MSTTARGDLTWADGTFAVRLGLAELRMLQEATGYGPQALTRRIASGDWKVDELRETIRLGLIGGGMAPHPALVKVMRYVDDRPLLESVEPALKVLDLVLSGWRTEPLEKQKAKRNRTPRAASTSPRSSASGQ